MSSLTPGGVPATPPDAGITSGHNGDTPTSSTEARRVCVDGRVQGVGYRPFIARQAASHGVAGWVRNTPEGVEIHVEGSPAVLDAFLERLRNDAPVAADVRSIDVLGASNEPGLQGPFRIVSSATTVSGRAGVPVVPPDRAACPECQAEFLDPSDRRFGYALIACEECGPRFTAITVLPFDRERTTMEGFPLCPDCRLDYESPGDRRFHAQMTACAACGPRLWVEAGGAQGEPSGGPNDLSPLEDVAGRLREGQIIGIKGIGGFHLLCDATSEATVALLRERKRRERKPFAVLFGDLDQLFEHLEAGTAERQALADPSAPIVLLPRRPESTIASAVAPGLASVGAMLAYTPAHRALVRLSGVPLVATSANASDEPMPVDNAVARGELAGVADALLLHDRPINRPADDSVARVINGRSVPMRVGRGLSPVRLNLPADLPPLLAVGAHLKAAVAYARGDTIVLGPHVGDLGTAAVRRRFREVTSDLGRLLGIEPSAVVCDAHPDYFSTRFAHELGLPVVSVQHHVAHAAATLAEHGERGPALGITWDGTGLGSDGGTWGGEFFRVEPGRAERVGSLWPFPLVGGDRAAREPRRVAAGLLSAAELWGTPPVDEFARGWFTSSDRRLLDVALRSPRASAVCTSAGRLFDAWAALLGLSDRAAYEAEAALRLEDTADPFESGSLPVVLSPEPRASAGEPSMSRPSWRLDWRPWVAETLADLGRGVPPAVLAARFQNGLADACVEAARRVGLETVVLGGGCFQNARLSARVETLLTGAGFRVLTPRRIPPGDGGLAVGQLWAAALGFSSAKIGGMGQV
jgi:hydrogenase maturation protein HypF